jgi:hypothetical protein
MRAIEPEGGTTEQVISRAIEPEGGTTEQVISNTVRLIRGLSRSKT